MPEAKKCWKCAHPLRSDNKVGICGDAAACRKRQGATPAPVDLPAPKVGPKLSVAPTNPWAAQATDHYARLSNDDLAEHIRLALSEREKRLVGVEALRAATATK